MQWPNFFGGSCPVVHLFIVGKHAVKEVVTVGVQ